MNNNEAKNKKIGNICRKMEFASVANKNGVMNMMPTSEANITQFIHSQNNAVVFETKIPNMDQYEDLWAFSATVLQKNKNMLFGSYDLDMEESTLSFRSTMYCKDVDDIRSKEVRFHANLGFQMAVTFMEYIKTESEDDNYVPAKDTNEAMYG